MANIKTTKPDAIIRNERTERLLLEYILNTTSQSEGWWAQKDQGYTLSRKDQLKEWRLRYKARRSVAQLFQDAKTQPFPRSSNLGVGIEQIFGERLIATTLGNTVDLEPSVFVADKATGMPDPTLIRAHDSYLRNVMNARQIYEVGHREVFTTGSCVTKWTWLNNWRQREVSDWVLGTQDGVPLVQVDPNTGEETFVPIDPKTPSDLLPKGAKAIKLAQVQFEQIAQGPHMSIRPLEAIDSPVGATEHDPNNWDWIGDNYAVSPWWFLGREGDPFDGKLQNIRKLWKQLNIDPSALHKTIDGKFIKPIRVKEWHGKFPVTKSGRPVEVIGLVAPEHKLLLAWRICPWSRRPFFNHQVWSRVDSPFGVGIPESVWALRSAMDAQLNQDIDLGNLYNAPPLLLSTMAVMDDEDYNETGPGAKWFMRDINGAKFLPPPIPKRDPITMLNWLLGMTQRLWGVTDLTLNAPTSSLSPNISTATGASIVQAEGTIKFGHMTKRLEATRSDELTLFHEMRRTMTTGPVQIVADGKVVEADREIFRPDVFVRAVGDGIQTNPQLRQKTLQEFYALMHQTQNPFVVADPEVLQSLTKQLTDASGIKLAIKDSEAMQQMQLLQEIASTEIGQQKLGEAAQLIDLQKQMEMANGTQGQTESSDNVRNGQG